MAVLGRERSTQKDHKEVSTPVCDDFVAVAVAAAAAAAVAVAVGAAVATVVVAAVAAAIAAVVFAAVTAVVVAAVAAAVAAAVGAAVAAAVGTAVAAVVAQSKKIFRKSGVDAFMTSQINYVGWVYHPESMNRVCVTNLAYLRRSDAVMAQFLSSGVILRRAVYRYAENRCNDKYTDEEREAINASIGKVGTDYKVIAEAIEKYRESDSDNELMTNLEIFVEIASSLKGKVAAGAITGYKKLLELSDQADSIDEMVNEYHVREGSLTKRECFNAIKDTLPISFTDKAKNVYLNRLHREDIKTIHVEAARIQKLNPSLDTSAILGQIEASHTSLSTTL